MIRGISFLIPNKYGSVLKLIFENVNVEAFTWYNIEGQDQVFGAHNAFIFDQNQYSGEQFKRIIEQDDYYTLSVKLQASPINQFENINNYNDFLNGVTQIVLLICDGIYVEVYIKDWQIVNIIKSNAQRYHFSDIEYITDENDQRTAFNV